MEQMNSILSFFEQLTIGKKLMLSLAPLITIIITMKMAILGLMILIIFDLITGIMKSMHIKKIPFNPFKKIFWKNIKSYLLRQTWRKTYEYGIGIIIFVIFETFIIGVTPLTLFTKTFTLSELAVIIPSAIEIWSIYENLEAISGYNVFKVIKKVFPTGLGSIFTSAKVKLTNYLSKND